jgi:hypothetical protein
MSKRTIRLVLALGCSGLGMGCATLNTPAPQASLTVALSGPPPAAKVEAAPTDVASSSNWEPGYWDQVQGTWLWHEGHTVAVHPGYDFVPASYVQTAGAWTLVLPHWQKTAPQNAEQTAQATAPQNATTTATKSAPTVARTTPAATRGHGFKATLANQR